MPSLGGSSSAQDILRSLDNISVPTILVVAAGAWLSIALLQRAVPWLADHLPARYRFYILPLSPILRIVILGGAALQITLLLIEPTAQNILALVGGSALALGFAFKDYASSIIAGVVALYEQPYRPGDWVRIGDDYGEVQSVGLRAVKIVTPDHDTVAIPHLRIWTENIANANSGHREHQCVAEFYLEPQHDAEVARRALMDVALTSPYVQLANPIVVIVGEQLWATRYRLKAYPIDGRNQYLFTSDLTVRGKQALAELAILPAGHNFGAMTVTATS